MLQNFEIEEFYYYWTCVQGYLFTMNGTGSDKAIQKGRPKDVIQNWSKI
jgi:hypothetical protein